MNPVWKDTVVVNMTGVVNQKNIVMLAKVVNLNSEDVIQQQVSNKEINDTLKKNDINEWRCGKDYGSCKKGYCCSKYGWQSIFGNCE